jgi:hypothetical protein
MLLQLIFLICFLRDKINQKNEIFNRLFSLPGIAMFCYICAF